MFNYIIVAILSYLLGIFSIIIFSIMKVSSECSRKEETNIKKEDYGQVAYEEIEKREKESEVNV